ncbi:branched-chain amino acid ABC transporter permease [Nocardioides sp. GY 10127]|uniref:branched-chain amino acid ABC transporter permease n=1 Tax=Nocardioides sp. GY 10127 TaxID=2569762 RepID=UPI0010A7E1AE|nr:branched-chain amino acid ABC transporter permease [Nocardioides sp. GY 10127]TIC81770.1 branched-chain amino acid ABC transporter permease [Nocardioides sp. GY 10127]
MDWVNALAQGALLGGFYALLAAGLSLMFGVMRIVNLAHGLLAVAGAYVGVVVVEDAGLPLWVALVVAPLVLAGFGYLLQRGFLNRAVDLGGLVPVLVTFGVAVILTNLLQEWFTADSQSLRSGSFGTASVQLADGLSIGLLPAVTGLAGVLVVAALQWFLARTRSGRAMRAASDDPEVARLMGINEKHVYALATAIALATVGLAGVFLGMRTQFTPGYGDLVLIFAFEAVIIGGLGSLWGTLLGGLVLGVTQSLGSQIDPAYGFLIGHLVFLAVLAVRPAGLLPKVAVA